MGTVIELKRCGAVSPGRTDRRPLGPPRYGEEAFNAADWNDDLDLAEVIDWMKLSDVVGGIAAGLTPV